MSVLIKGMEIPHSCASCLWEFQNYCYLINDRVESCDRDPKCPLVEVPTPHGRLIDADTITPILASWMSDEEELKWIIERINYARTVIEEEL